MDITHNPDIYGDAQSATESRFLKISGASTVPADIVMHSGTPNELRITPNGVNYRGESIEDAGAVHQALMEVLNGRPLPAFDPAVPISHDTQGNPLYERDLSKRPRLFESINHPPRLYGAQYDRFAMPSLMAAHWPNMRAADALPELGPWDKWLSEGLSASLRSLEAEIGARDAVPAVGGALVAKTDEQQDQTHVMPPTRGTDSQHDADLLGEILSLALQGVSYGLLADDMCSQIVEKITGVAPHVADAQRAAETASYRPNDAEKLAAAIHWINGARHGDNCFLHDEGEYNRCFCGKDSVLSYIDGDDSQGGVTQANSAESSATGSAAAPAEQYEARRWCKGDAEWTNWRAISTEDYAKYKDDSTFECRIATSAPIPTGEK